ncbi:MAG: Rieske (2Fe-2S) protein [Hyphomonadaceae bacterium]
MSPNPARPAAGARIARLADIGEKDGHVFDFRAGEARFSMFIARRGERLFAYENSCPHIRAPLERYDGFVSIEWERYIVCAFHGASFELTTGARTGGPAKSGLTAIPLNVREGWICMGEDPTPAAAP